jgi:hypothetical protein
MSRAAGGWPATRAAAGAAGTCNNDADVRGLMTEPQPIGWQVTGPDGAVVESGPPVVMEAASESGREEEGAGDGRDRAGAG